MLYHKRTLGLRLALEAGVLLLHNSMSELTYLGVAIIAFNFNPDAEPFFLTRDPIGYGLPK